MTPLEQKQEKIINALSKYIIHIKLGYAGLQRDLEEADPKAKLQPIESPLNGTIPDSQGVKC